MLKNKNFRNLWIGRLLSNIGDSIYYIVISWYVLQTTGDAFLLGVVNFCFYAPNLINFLFGGYAVYKGIIASNLNSVIFFGVLNSVYAIGSMLGNTFIGVYLERRMGMSKLFLSSLLATTVTLLFCAFFANTLYVSLFLVLFGITLGVRSLLTMPIFNILVSNDKQGVFLSAYYTISVGILPFGSLFFGYFAQYISSVIFFIIFAASMFIFFLVLLNVPEFRKISIKKPN